jgi:hypothetical protein
MVDSSCRGGNDILDAHPDLIRPIDANDVRAKVREHHPSERERADSSQFQNAEAAQGAARPLRLVICVKHGTSATGYRALGRV